MPFPLIAAVGQIGTQFLGKFTQKIAGHGARVARKKDQQKIAASIGVSYECVRQIQSAIYTNPNNEPWGPNKKAGQACTPKIAQDLGYNAWQTGAFDELSGKPLIQTHPELYQSLQQIDNNGSQDSRQRGQGVEISAQQDTGISFGRQRYEARPQGADPRYVGSALYAGSIGGGMVNSGDALNQIQAAGAAGVPTSSGSNSAILLAVAGVAVLVVLVSFGGRR